MNSGPNMFSEEGSATSNGAASPSAPQMPVEITTREAPGAVARGTNLNEANLDSEFYQLPEAEIETSQIITPDEASGGVPIVIEADLSSPAEQYSYENAGGDESVPPPGPPDLPTALASAHEPPPPPAPPELDIFEHLGELRQRILYCVAATAVALSITWNFGTQLTAWFSHPISQVLKQHNTKDTANTLITIGPMEAFMVYFQITLVAALLLVMPFILFQMWRFIEPALTRHERRYGMVMLPFSVILFFTGSVLGYFMSPVFFGFFLAFQPPGVAANYSYGESATLLAKMLLVFGVCFQVPVITIFLHKIGIVSRNVLIQYWRHVVLVIFVVVAIITPTWDPFTLVVCALPPCILYAVSIWLIKWL